MALRVTTKSGSVYRIDLDAMRWERLSKSEKSGAIRTEDGDIYSIEGLNVGDYLMIGTNSITTAPRYVLTSQVMKIEGEGNETGNPSTAEQAG